MGEDVRVLGGGFSHDIAWLSCFEVVNLLHGYFDLVFRGGHLGGLGPLAGRFLLGRTLGLLSLSFMKVLC